MVENRVDYILEDGTRGVWEYEMVGNFAEYIDLLSFIDKKLGGQLKELVLVKITEKDTARFTRFIRCTMFEELPEK